MGHIYSAPVLPTESYWVWVLHSLLAEAFAFAAREYSEKPLGKKLLFFFVPLPLTLCSPCCEDRARSPLARRTCHARALYRCSVPGGARGAPGPIPTQPLDVNVVKQGKAASGW